MAWSMGLLGAAGAITSASKFFAYLNLNYGTGSRAGGIAGTTDNGVMFAPVLSRRDWLHTKIESDLSGYFVKGFDNPFPSYNPQWDLRGMESDGEGNIYAGGYLWDQGQAKYPILLKLNEADGSLIWARRIPSSSGNDDITGFNYKNGKVFSGGTNFTHGTSGYMGYWVFNSDGSLALAWDTTAIGYAEGQSAVGDSDGNCYGFTFDNQDGTYPAVVVKVNSSGQKIWNRKIGGGTNMGFAATNTSIDLNGNPILSGLSFATKINSTDGTFAWQKSISGLSMSGNTSDADGNIYFAGFESGNLFLFKFSRSGTLLWQREVNSSIGTLTAFAKLSIDQLGDLLVVCGGKTDTATFVAKLPSDGSLTGSYSFGGDTIVYSASSKTVTNGNLGNVVQNVTVNTRSISSVSQSLNLRTRSETITTLELV